MKTVKSLPKRLHTDHLVFLLFLFAGSYFHHPVDYDNTCSRLFMVSAAVDFGVLHIDPYADLTGDKSRAGDHYYSNKAVGAPLLGIPVYWVYRELRPWPEHP
ncbi:MAG: hypothetical protein JW821_17890, partial [Deltaproteobacteria bacterium]|nr:hypothetical protein [Deltaproteobacteria bacterium]